MAENTPDIRQVIYLYHNGDELHVSIDADDDMTNRIGAAVAAQEAAYGIGPVRIYHDIDQKRVMFKITGLTNVDLRTAAIAGLTAIITAAARKPEPVKKINAFEPAMSKPLPQLSKNHEIVDMEPYRAAAQHTDAGQQTAAIQEQPNPATQKDRNLETTATTAQLTTAIPTETQHTASAQDIPDPINRMLKKYELTWGEASWALELKRILVQGTPLRDLDGNQREKLERDPGWWPAIVKRCAQARESGEMPEEIANTHRLFFPEDKGKEQTP